MKRALIITVNDQLDQHLVQHLVSENYIVRIISESVNAGDPLLKLPVEIFPGNPADNETVGRAAKGCSSLIYTQPAFTEYPPITSVDRSCLETNRMIEAAKKGGVETVIQISDLPLKNQADFAILAPEQFRLSEYSKPVAIEKKPAAITEGRPHFISIYLCQLTMGDESNCPSEDRATICGAITDTINNGENGASYFIRCFRKDNNRVGQPKANYYRLLPDPKTSPAQLSKNFLRILNTWTRLFALTAIMTS